MRNRYWAVMAVVALVFGVAGPAGALSYDADVTNNVIFGTGNGNGAWTIDQANGIELGLRAKIPFTGTYNSNGDGTYSYALGTTWNFEWSINSDYGDIVADDTDAVTLDTYIYVLGVDFDPTLGRAMGLSCPSTRFRIRLVPAQCRTTLSATTRRQKALAWKQWTRRTTRISSLHPTSYRTRGGWISIPATLISYS